MSTMLGAREAVWCLAMRRGVLAVVAAFLLGVCSPAMAHSPEVLVISQPITHEPIKPGEQLEWYSPGGAPLGFDSLEGPHQTMRCADDEFNGIGTLLTNSRRTDEVRFSGAMELLCLEGSEDVEEPTFVRVNLSTGDVTLKLAAHGASRLGPSSPVPTMQVVPWGLAGESVGPGCSYTAARLRLTNPLFHPANSAFFSAEFVRTASSPRSCEPRWHLASGGGTLEYGFVVPIEVSIEHG
jgi:hypothetical protein